MVSQAEKRTREGERETSDDVEKARSNEQRTVGQKKDYMPRKLALVIANY